MNFKIIIDDIFNIISKKQSFFEFLLNLSFVLIIFAIVVVIYWDSINRSIINTNRCKINIDNDDLTYNIKVYNPDKENANIFDISYDNSVDKNIKIDCSCPAGDTINKFNIPYYNNKDRKVQQLEKYCYCSQNYQYDNLTSLKTEGDAFLVDYYDNIFNRYTNGYQFNEPLIFPQ